ncbi:hypothetical protein DYD21_08720 [Rhodohalobacter sp. SW132]|uniref:VCBS repeat-containing protein n=1 Tax=Rhodohalobacter sp. SW132 TaxID=2293433 RepID=UPI000E220A31|nr:VCBS repeat-containing protein [Rhodohalobacter sp. SW132]REL37854.1 hypothetical protein DYD21_08720 [Rhodohalobacter sp. SW132]
MAIHTRLIFIFIIFALCLSGCTPGDQADPLFRELSSDHTSITFNNAIVSNDTLNAQTDHFLYNGAGVAAGDINNNGLTDLFFSGNFVQSRLYLNQGNMEFQDITEHSGIQTDRRVTGVSMVDLNGNGYLDIYLSVSGAPWSSPENRRNLLYLNNGDNTFTEAASDYSIDDPGFTTHAIFLDYNKSGYLDLFLLGNSPEEFGRGDTGGSFSGARAPNPYGLDRLYRNNGDGTFTDVSEDAGILNRLGYGLGVVATDLNNNGWPDIYVSNDITPNDVLYMNNGDGTFTDKAAEYLKHTSFAGMGIDIADFSNNGWADIMQTDMMPVELEDQKRMSGSTSYSAFQQLRNQGYFPHYNTNTLQFNRGTTPEGDIIFSEIGRMAGVAYTDWSWAALFADFDNDGLKDLFVSNGYPKAVNDFDYLSDMHRVRQTADSPDQIKQRELEILENLHSYEIPNHIFKNNGDLTFTDKTSQWGIDHPRFSYGAAYADLNNNGRLDLIISNINSTAQIYENTGAGSDENGYLQIVLDGDSSNRQGLGSRIILTHNGVKQTIYHTPYRGYMSTVDHRIHFGLGDSAGDTVDSLEIYWPDDRYQLLTDVEKNQVLTLSQADADSKPDTNPDQKPKIQPLLEPVQPINGFDITHGGSRINDFNIQTTLPYKVTSQNITIAAGDITGNGLDDIYIGGSADTAGKLYLQQEDGEFIEFNDFQPWERDKRYDDWDAHFFDANGNGLLDLYVSSGSFRLSNVSELLQDRLYINQGGGRFIRDEDALPNINTATAAITPGDFNGNGRMDLFIGGRLSQRNYPHPVRSYILRNDGGRFTDVTESIAPELIHTGGMVTDAVWIDFTGNNTPDLVTVGEWMPIRFYENNGAQFNDVTESMNLPPSRGWWYSLTSGDINNNGHTDLIAGNLGLNFTYKTSPESRFGVYAGDFNENWRTELIFVQEIDGIEYPFHGLAKLGNSINQLGYSYDRFEDFSNEPIHRLFNREKLDQALHYQVDTFASTVLINNGDGTFANAELPTKAQISPINDSILHDIDCSGTPDLIIAGNIFETEPNIPRADAGKGLILRGDGSGSFSPVPLVESGFHAPEDAKKLLKINTPEGPVLLVANHNSTPNLFLPVNSCRGQ